LAAATAAARRRPSASRLAIALTQGAAGAVRVPVVQPRRPEDVRARAVGEQVDRLARQVAALHEHPARPERQHRLGGPRQSCLVLDPHAGQLLDLGQVRA
jgi:hypothetical protein